MRWPWEPHKEVTEEYITQRQRVIWERYRLYVSLTMQGMVDRTESKGVIFTSLEDHNLLVNHKVRPEDPRLKELKD